MSKPYDIFISYRRQGGAQYARILQLMLSRRGYEVFLDYDELTDGIFGDHIREAILNSSVFMLILSEGALDRCVNEDDWVRQEISLAVSERKHIIPVDPDGAFKGMPDEVPDFIKAVANVYISIMNQYMPMEQIKNHPLLSRKVTKREYSKVVDYALSLGWENGFIQEGETAEESFIPGFYGEGV